ncbi:hypothetical protein [Clostridium pasteurianum]|uniref:hypothetical protein n=1 Tax=Clostridium pasteurianum TaxID=1501 RepID=UPI0008243D50
MFGIRNEKSTIKWNRITDNQYRQLVIQPERATMNFNIEGKKFIMSKFDKLLKKIKTYLVIEGLKN